MIQVRLILQPVTVEKSAPILLYGNFFRFSTDHMIASDNGGDVFVPADGVNMFILLRHRREDGRQMGDIVSLDSIIQVVDLFPQFGTTVMYRIFFIVLRLSRDIPACSQPFPCVL